MQPPMQPPIQPSMQPPAESTNSSRAGGTAAGLAVVAICLLFCWHDSRFFWNDDYQMTFLPVFEEVNRAWRAGEWPLLTQGSWVCGNLAG